MFPPAELESALPSQPQLEITPTGTHASGVAARAAALLQTAQAAVASTAPAPAAPATVCVDLTHGAAGDASESDEAGEADMLLAMAKIEETLAKRRKLQPSGSAASHAAPAGAAEALPAAPCATARPAAPGAPVVPMVRPVPPAPPLQAQAVPPHQGAPSAAPEPTMRHAVGAPPAGQATRSAHMPGMPATNRIAAACALRDVANSLEAMAGQLRTLASSAALDPWGWQGADGPPAWVVEAARVPSACAQHVYDHVLRAEQQHQWRALPQPLASLALAAAPFIVPVWHDTAALDDLQIFVLRTHAALAARASSALPAGGAGGHAAGVGALQHGGRGNTR